MISLRKIPSILLILIEINEIFSCVNNVKIFINLLRRITNLIFIITDFLESPNNSEEPQSVHNARRLYSLCMDTGN